MVTHSQSSITTQRVIEGYQSCVLSVAKARYFISILVPHMLTAMLLGPEFTYLRRLQYGKWAFGMAFLIMQNKQENVCG